MVVNFNFLIMSIFSKIPVKKPSLVPHNLSSNIDFSSEFGRLTPLKYEKVVPGDVIPIQVLHQEQFSPLATKLFQEFRVKTESFFVPSRILWDDFGKFFVAEDNEYLHPYVTPASLFKEFCTNLCSKFSNLNDVNGTDIFQSIFWSLFGPNSVFHYVFGSCLGLTETLGFTRFMNDYSDLVDYDKNNAAFILNYDRFNTFPSLWKKFDALRILAYYRVMSEYYLDENIMSDLVDYITDLEPNSQDWSGIIAKIIVEYIDLFLSSGHSSNLSTLRSLFIQNINLFAGFFFRCWPKDYFAGSLPFKQAGNAVDIPLQGNGDLDLTVTDATAALLADNTLINNVNLVVAANQEGVAPGYTRVYLQYQNSDGGVNGDATTVEPIQRSITVGGIHTTIEDFRTAYQLQEWLEINARGGHRYKEQIFAHFGVKTKDSRLDRPEFIVGSTDGVNYGNVFTTFQDADGSGVPAESITAISAGGRSRSGVYRVTEHGYIFTIHSIYPLANYALGLFRQGYELDKFDYFWPEFQHLGEQEVHKCEVLGNIDESVFGYQPRYAQYKTRPNQVHGDFIDSLPTFTDFRHIAYANLSPSFISIIPQFSNLNRIFNYTSTDYSKIYCSVRINSPALRPIDYYGVPRLFL